MNTRVAADAWLPDEPLNGPVMQPTMVFAASNPYSLNDWSVAAFGGLLHAVRRLQDGSTFEHRTFDPRAGGWVDGGRLTAAAGRVDSGVVLLPYADGLLLFAVTGDSRDAIQVSGWNGSQWTPWTTIVDGAADRNDITAASGDGTHAAILWTQASMGAGYDMVGATLP
jgi:hypothetical protein